jgi:hypothetical protein
VPDDVVQLASDPYALGCGCRSSFLAPPLLQLLGLARQPIHRLGTHTEGTADRPGGREQHPEKDRRAAERELRILDLVQRRPEQCDRCGEDQAPRLAVAPDRIDRDERRQERAERLGSADREIEQRQHGEHEREDGERSTATPGERSGDGEEDAGEERPVVLSPHERQRSPHVQLRQQADRTGKEHVSQREEPEPTRQRQGDLRHSLKVDPRKRLRIVPRTIRVIPRE